jgi:hypothetical protein
MEFKRDVMRLLVPGVKYVGPGLDYEKLPPQTEAAVKMVCKKFGISYSHAEEIVGDIDKYQWHIERIRFMDDKVREFLREHDVVGAVKAIKAVRPDWGLLNCKLYMEDVRDGKKPWPAVKAVK